VDFLNNKLNKWALIEKLETLTQCRLDNVQGFMQCLVMQKKKKLKEPDKQPLLFKYDENMD
jgi:hypothetical protein